MNVIYGMICAPNYKFTQYKIIFQVKKIPIRSVCIKLKIFILQGLNLIRRKIVDKLDLSRVKKFKTRTLKKR